MKKTTAKIYNFARVMQDGIAWLVVVRKLNDENEWYWAYDSMHPTEELARTAFRYFVLKPQLS